MNTIGIYMVGALSFTGFVMDADVDTLKLFGSIQPQTITPCTVYDFVPTKTMYRDLNTGENIELWYDATGIRTLNKKKRATCRFLCQYHHK